LRLYFDRFAWKSNNTLSKERFRLKRIPKYDDVSSPRIRGLLILLSERVLILLDRRLHRSRWKSIRLQPGEDHGSLSLIAGKKRSEENENHRFL
jgi:hypothetical protein